MKTLITFIKWVGLVVSDNSTVSSKRVAFLAVVASAIVWLSADLHHHAITDNWLNAFNTLVVSVVGGYLGGKGIDMLMKKKTDTPADPESEPTDADGEAK
jgi:hypothetical protein